MLSVGRHLLIALLGLSALAWMTPESVAQFGGGFHVEKASYELVADKTSYGPGSRVRLAAQMSIEKGWHVNSDTPSLEYLRPTRLDLVLPLGASEPEFSYPPAKMLKFEFEEQPIAVFEGDIVIQAEFDLPADLPAGPVEILASLHYQACDDSQCLPPLSSDRAIEIEIGEDGTAIHAAVFAAAAGVASSSSTAIPAASASGLLKMLFLAMIGGLILNAMPCVLPVLSLKVFGLVKSAGEGRKAVVSGALAMTAGILVSFWILGLVVIGARSAGQLIGWGNHFQFPGFVAFLAVVVVLFALNMWGLFEIPLPQSVARAAGSAPREGLAGHFASGFFATLMATPCSAPFLGTAVGFALAQSAMTILAIFSAVGLGLALPYIALAIIPGAARFLPKPGAWMVKFKEIMGFLLAAAAVWLFYVLAGQIAPESIAFIQLSLLLLALAAWWYGSAQGPRRSVAAVTMLVAAVLTIGLASQAPAVAGGSGVQASKWIDWVAFDEIEAQSLTAEGKLVFVDVTADWCLTCKTTERIVIETETIARAFEEHDVVAMKADWTNRDDRITEFLARFGKSAVPFYVLYRPGQEPHAFGEVLTKGSLVDALSEARAVASLQ